MTRVALAAFAAVLTTLVFAPQDAHAGACDGHDLKGKYLSRCKTMHARCKHDRGKARTKCESTAISNAKKAQQQDKAGSALDPTNPGGGVCTSAKYTSKCFSLKARRDSLCKRSMIVRFGAYEADKQKAEADAFRSQLKSYVDLAPDYAAFKKSYGKCANARGVKCSLSINEGHPCANAKDAYVKGWSAYVDFFEKTRIPELKRELASVKKAKGATVTGENKTMDRGAREGAFIAAINREVSWIAVKQKRVDALAAQAKALQSKVDAIYQKRIANVRCPRAKVKNRGLTGTLKKVTVEHLAGLEKRGTGMKETVVRFGLMGKAKRKRVAVKRLTHEDVPATTCVRQVKPTRTNCRIFNVTLRRTKPDGGAWGAWGFHSIGGGELMSCKNL